MRYDLNGRKYILTVNVEEYEKEPNRPGSDLDEQNLIETFQDQVKPS